MLSAEACSARRPAIPAAPVALLAAAAYLLAAGRRWYGIGGSSRSRIWQGAMLAAVVLPLVFLHAPG